MPVLHHEGTIAETDYEKADMLNNFFSSCFNTAVPPLCLHHDSASHLPCPDDLLCTSEQMLSYIQSLDSDKASGCDGISTKMLKGTARSVAEPLTKLFNKSICLGHFPNSWKISSVVPIPKTSQIKEASNYRPISLLPVVSKLIERHIHKEISIHLQDHQLLYGQQWGFQPGKSTATALLSVTNEWHKILEQGQSVGAVFSI